MQKKIYSMLAVVALSLMVISSVQMAGAFSYAAASSVDINDLLNNPTTTPAPSEDAESTTGVVVDESEKPVSDNDFINSLTGVMDATTPESDQVKAFGAKVQKVTSVIVQGLTYIFTGGLIISKLIDLFYVGIPLTRSFLANGYAGNAASVEGQGMGGMMNGGMGGMGMGGMMNGGMGMGGMGMGGYGRGRYGGMGNGMGMGGMNGMMGGPGGNSGMVMNNQPMRGRIQFVSNAALNAVAAESANDMDGKPQNAIKIYWKDAMISLIAAPVLLVLCITGSVANIGFALGAFLGDVLGGIRF